MYQEHGEAGIERQLPEGIADARQSIWISYADLKAARRDERALTRFDRHHMLAAPRFGWESAKIGAGPPPVLTHLGWLCLYHGVAGRPGPVGADGARENQLRYAAGVMILDRADPRRILYRARRPLLRPAAGRERVGIMPNVVFPTGMDPRGAHGPWARVDVYYGMADTAIGAAALYLPARLPPLWGRCLRGRELIPASMPSGKTAEFESIAFVTVLRLAQVGAGAIRGEREATAQRGRQRRVGES
jgi:hypothetical protein